MMNAQLVILIKAAHFDDNYVHMQNLLWYDKERALDVPGILCDRRVRYLVKKNVALWASMPIILICEMVLFQFYFF